MTKNQKSALVNLKENLSVLFGECEKDEDFHKTIVQLNIFPRSIDEIVVDLNTELEKIND